MRSVLACGLLSACAATPPNIIFILTDDQDQVLGGSFPTTAPDGATPMPQTRELLQARGAMATNAFIHTPVCCPSRAETLTGRYLHNLKTPGRCTMAYDGFDPATGGACCMHVEEDKVHDASFVAKLHEAGYATGLFGKYLNFCPGNCSDECSGEPIPRAFDTFFGNGGGEYLAPSFAVKNVAGLPDGTYDGADDEYTTALVGNRSVAWIRAVVAAAKEPFLAYVAPKACHDPFVPAPWYATARPAGWPRAAPRPPSFNLSAAARARHHATVAAMGTVTDEVAACIDDDFANRWRTLMSVDDVIAALIGETDALGVTERTFFLFSSDHGYSLGELNLNWDKRNVYDFDTRIHLLVRGPGIAPGRAIAAPLTNVDLAPTILDMAGIFDYDAGDVDGRSLLPLLLDDSDDDFMNPSSAWRADVYIEYTYIGIDGYCGMAEAIENPDSNFVAIRRVAGSARRDGIMGERPFLYAKFLNGTDGSVDFSLLDGSQHEELFYTDDDPWQMHNVFANASAELRAALRAEVERWWTCSGDACP